jgi:hypothetical protein
MENQTKDDSRDDDKGNCQGSTAKQNRLVLSSQSFGRSWWLAMTILSIDIRNRRGIHFRGESDSNFD